jgi:hypothetical protein
LDDLFFFCIFAFCVDSFWIAVAADELFVASGTLFIVAARVMKVAGECGAVVATRWISDQDSVMMLPGCGRLIEKLLLLPVGDWWHFSVHGSDGHGYASVGGVHRELTILADRH